VVGLGVTSDGEPMVLAVCEKGYGKRTLYPSSTPEPGRQRIILIDASERNDRWSASRSSTQTTK